MKIASYVLLSLLSCVEVLAGETAFDRAVEAYRTYKNAQHAYFEAIDAHEETRLAWDAYWAAEDAYWATDRAFPEAHLKAKAAWEEARDENKEVKGAYAIFQITGDGYNKALHAIEEVRLAFAAWKDAERVVDEAEGVYDAILSTRRTGLRAGAKTDWAALEEARAACEETGDTFVEAGDTYFTVLEVFEEAIKKAYERGEKNH